MSKPNNAFYPFKFHFEKATETLIVLTFNFTENKYIIQQ